MVHNLWSGDCPTLATSRIARSHECPCEHGCQPDFLIACQVLSSVMRIPIGICCSLTTPTLLIRNEAGATQHIRVWPGSGGLELFRLQLSNLLHRPVDACSLAFEVDVPTGKLLRLTGLHSYSVASYCAAIGAALSAARDGTQYGSPEEAGSSYDDWIELLCSVADMMEGEQSPGQQGQQGQGQHHHHHHQDSNDSKQHHRQQGPLSLRGSAAPLVKVWVVCVNTAAALGCGGGHPGPDKRQVPPLAPPLALPIHVAKVAPDYHYHSDQWQPSLAHCRSQPFCSASNVPSSCLPPPLQQQQQQQEEEREPDLNLLLASHLSCSGCGPLAWGQANPGAGPADPDVGGLLPSVSRPVPGSRTSSVGSLTPPECLLAAGVEWVGGCSEGAGTACAAGAAPRPPAPLPPPPPQSGCSVEHRGIPTPRVDAKGCVAPEDSASRQQPKQQQEQQEEQQEEQPQPQLRHERQPAQKLRGSSSRSGGLGSGEAGAQRRPGCLIRPLLCGLRCVICSGA